MAKRQAWIRAVEKVEALEPLYVVPGHCLEGEVYGKWHLENTKRYIRDFEKVVAAMTELYPDRFNVGAVIMGAMGALNAAKSKM